MVDAPATNHLHRLSPQEHWRLVEAGVVDENARVKRIDRPLVDMKPKFRAHENAVAWHAPAFRVRTQLHGCPAQAEEWAAATAWTPPGI